MGLLETAARRLLQEAEVRTGITHVDRSELQELREGMRAFEAFKEEASELGYHALSYFAGKPSELTPESRNRLAQRSRIALMEDPNAGAEADLLANFAFGRGITVPQAEDEAVQKIIDESWSDPINEQKLTSFEAQRHRSNELLTQAQLFPVAYVRSGRVRLGFLDADTVTHVICDPEDEERPLWYVTRKRRVEWDFENDRIKTTDEMKMPKVVYYPHWRNVEDYEEEVAADRDGAKQTGPPAGKRGAGLVEHIRINRIGRTQFGTPPWARTLRFFRALDDVVESHVKMAQAASTFIAKQVMTGSPEALTRSANAVLSQSGEIGASRFSDGPEAFPAHPAPPAGSHWLENEARKLEPLQLNSGAAQAMQTAQIVRAPISAASSFGQHYLGDAGNANLATATSLELPTLMAVQAWQETMKGLLDWYTNLVVQEAVRAGRLGGYGLQESDESVPPHVLTKPLSELRLSEAEDREEMERRTGKSLKYTITLPYPGRRNLPDVTTTVTGIVTAFDPQGVNVPLRRRMLMFLAQHGMQLDDPAAFVDEVLPEDSILDMMPGLDPATGEPYPDERSEDYVPKDVKYDPDKQDLIPKKSSRRGGDQGGKGERPSGARRPKTEMGERERERAAAARALGSNVAYLFEEEVLDPLLSVNGSAG